MRNIIFFLIFTFSFLNADISEYFPKLEGRVIDQANLLSSNVKNDIDKILENEENKSSNQIVVVILNSLNGYAIEDFSYQLGRFWGIGQKDKNNGVLLVIALNERQIRIEVGYGLEGVLTDKIAYEIINYTIKPNFKANQYELGILKAVNEIIKSVQGEYIAQPKTKEYNSPTISFFGNFIFFGLVFFSIIFQNIAKIKKSQLLYKISGSSAMSSVITIFTYYNFLSALIIFLILFILFYISTKKVNFDKLSKDVYIGHSNSSSSTRSSYSGSFSSNSSSRSFSGGGGNFGGGGASGSW